MSLHVLGDREQSGPDLVIAGNLIVDDLVLDEGPVQRGVAGGATLYAALSASLWGTRTGIVSRVGSDYPPHVLQELAARGVDLTGIHSLSGPGARTWLLYEGSRRHIVSHLERPTHVEVSPVASEIPSQWRAARIYHVAPMPLEVQKLLVLALGPEPGRLVTLDPCESLSRDKIRAWRPVLEQIDILFLGPDELEPGLDEHDIPAVLRQAAPQRLKVLVLKQGARGGVVHDLRDGTSIRWSAGPWPVVDPTGAGDSFAAGFLTGLLDGASMQDCVFRGVVSAGLAIEDWGPAGLLAATPARARSRLNELVAGDGATLRGESRTHR